MRQRILLAATLALSPVLASAAEPASGGGMPQLRFGDPMVIAQVVWLLIIFGLLYYIMANYALPGVAAVLEDRRRRIEGDLEAAHEAKGRADQAFEEHRAATAKARGEAQGAIAAATQRAQVAAGVQSVALNARLNTQIDEAERRIAAARDSAMGALRQVAAETAEALVGRLIGANDRGAPDRGAVDRAVDRELVARGRA